MFYGEKWLEGRIDKLKEINVKRNFNLNDLFLLISFRQVVPNVKSVEEINNFDLSYNFQDASSIPLLTNYLEDKGVLFNYKLKNLNLIDKSIGILEEMALIENSALYDNLVIPRMEAKFTNHDGTYIVQAVKNFEEYKTKQISDSLFFDYPFFFEQI